MYSYWVRTYATALIVVSIFGKWQIYAPYIAVLRKSCEYQKMSLIEEITVKNLDHLGIVAGLIDEIGIVEVINQKTKN